MSKTSKKKKKKKTGDYGLKTDNKAVTQVNDDLDGPTRTTKDIVYRCSAILFAGLCFQGSIIYDKRLILTLDVRTHCWHMQLTVYNI